MTGCLVRQQRTVVGDVAGLADTPALLDYRSTVLRLGRVRLSALTCQAHAQVRQTAKSPLGAAVRVAVVERGMFAGQHATTVRVAVTSQPPDRVNTPMGSQSPVSLRDPDHIHLPLPALSQAIDSCHRPLMLTQ